MRWDIKKAKDGIPAQSLPWMTQSFSIRCRVKDFNSRFKTLPPEEQDALVYRIIDRVKWRYLKGAVGESSLVGYNILNLKTRTYTLKSSFLGNRTWDLERNKAFAALHVFETYGKNWEKQVMLTHTIDSKEIINFMNKDDRFHEPREKNESRKRGREFGANDEKLQEQRPKRIRTKSRKLDVYDTM